MYVVALRSSRSAMDRCVSEPNRASVERLCGPGGGPTYRNVPQRGERPEGGRKVAPLDGLRLRAGCLAVCDGQRIRMPAESRDRLLRRDESTEVTNLQEHVQIHRVLQRRIKQANLAHGIDSDEAARMRDQVRAPRDEPLRQPTGFAGDDGAP